MTDIVASVCFEVRAYLFFTFIPVARRLVMADEMLVILKKFEYCHIRMCLRIKQGNGRIWSNNTCETLVVHKCSIKTLSYLANRTVGLFYHYQVEHGVCMHQL